MEKDTKKSRDFELNENEETGRCSECGAEVPVSLLSFLPETEKYYRELLLKKDPTAVPPLNVDSSILLCPNCMAKWEQEHKKD